MSYTNVESRPGQQSRHGQVFKPESRGQLCVDGVNAQCPLQSWQVNGLEGGKFFPAIAGGLRDPLAPDDVANVAPPADGKIASAGQAFAAVLDEQSAERWHKHPVKSGQTQEFHWSYHAVHLTRRWNYFITKPGWNPNQPLSRAQFESEPFYKVELTAQPYWSHGAELMPPDPTIHNVRLPERQGYQVVLAVWEVADTGNAFYQVIDFDFS
ncbi:lytic polysaccharide monooxygenase auxiliary activity family 9 protein [Chromobacterium haemolyticum]|uniref:lytic polysaccharide monooxygenase auxiliary activity family 9 protein n=1 Tax=Chromobacterium haemolyticum TaxID=394935 RepID=UPI00244A5BF1|nr:lytic polysaccharide monooxygenase [Chromobacterium haemolyticum]MDH0343085.1 lytic polysaccharide monooxygenase [Chromobacterium haemolyticum]